MRRLMLTVALLAALGGAAGQTAEAHLIRASKPLKVMTLTQQANYYRQNAWHAERFLRSWGDITAWQIIGRHHQIERIPTPAVVKFHQRLLLNSIRGLKTVERKVFFSLVPHYYAWLCIHRYEGAWNASTGNGFYGGLQMDLSFQRTYGSEFFARKGTANNWTPMEQMIAAERAFTNGRGFNPWPNTARMCGLI